MSLVSRPGRSSSQIRPAASAASRPSSCIAWAIRSAMPTPAAPAPKTTTCSSVRRPPETCTPARAHARPIDAVPWMSSSNVRLVSPYRARMPRAVGAAKSSQWRIALREAPAGALHVGVDEAFVLLAAGTGAAQAQVARIGQQLLAVGADVQSHREHPVRVDPGCDRIHRELADRDVDAADAPVADAQNRLAVGGDDEVDVIRLEARELQCAIDAFDIVDVQENAPRATECLAELLDRRAHGGRVDDREHLGDVLADQPVEEHLVAVVQLAQEDPLVEIVVQQRVLGVAARGLLLHRLDRPGKQSLEAEVSPLGFGERRAAVDARILEDLLAANVDLNGDGPLLVDFLSEGPGAHPCLVPRYPVAAATDGLRVGGQPADPCRNIMDRYAYL